MPELLDKEDLMYKVITDETWMVITFNDNFTDEGDDEVPDLNFFLNGLEHDDNFNPNKFQIKEILKYGKALEERVNVLTNRLKNR